jgi:membrane protein YqaA with SNARE-associated domain
VSAAAGLLQALGAGAMGFGSALVPLLNAEAYAVVAGATSTWGLVVVVALAVGQTAGKLVLFESARRGAERWSGPTKSSRGARWLTRISPWLRSGRTGPPLVLASAALGLPPLAVVALAAGASGQRRSLFAGLVLVGRTLRFGVMVISATQLAH